MHFRCIFSVLHRRAVSRSATGLVTCNRDGWRTALHSPPSGPKFTRCAAGRAHFLHGRAPISAGLALRRGTHVSLRSGIARGERPCARDRRRRTPVTAAVREHRERRRSSTAAARSAAREIALEAISRGARPARPPQAPAVVTHLACASRGADPRSAAPPARGLHARGRRAAPRRRDPRAAPMRR